MPKQPRSDRRKPVKPVKTKARLTQPDIFTQQSRFWVKHWKEACIILLSAVALYFRAVNYEFVLDDQIVIVDNNFTKKGIDGIVDIFAHDSFTGYFGEQKDLVVGSRYRPLSIAWFAVIHELYGKDPAVYHGANVLLYGLLCLLIFRVLALMFHEQFARSRWYFSAAFIGAMLYVVHPVHTEAVANVKGCDEILAMLGAMAALYAVMRFAVQRSWVWLGLSGVFFLAGIMAKENTITFLAVIPLTLYFFTSTRPLTWAMAVVPALLASAAYIAIRYSVIGYLFSENTAQDLLNNPFLEMTADQKGATIMYTLGLYAKLLFVPYPLTHDYYPYHIPMMEWTDIRTILSALLYAVLIGLGLYGTFKKHVYGYCILYFLATLSIVSNVFFPIGTFMNERFLFMPSLAFSIFAGYYAARYILSDVSWKKWVATGIAVLCFLAFAWRSWVRVPAWENAMSLNSAAIEVSENSARANCFMGTALYQEAQKVQHAGERLAMVRKAEIYIDKSLSIIPDYLSANQMKSGVVAEYYRYDRDLDKLLAGFAEVLERKPGVEYVAQYCEYLNERDVDVNKLLNFYYHVGYEILSKKLQRHDFGLKYLSYGYQLDPNNARINYGMGLAYIGWGDQQRSNFHLQRAYELDPRLATEPR